MQGCVYSKELDILIPIPDHYTCKSFLKFSRSNHNGKNNIKTLGLDKE